MGEKKTYLAAAYRRSWPVYHISGPVNRGPQAANRSGPVDLLPARLTGAPDRLAARRGRLAGVERRTGRPGGGPGASEGGAD